MVRTYAVNPSISTNLVFHDIGYTPRDKRQTTLRKRHSEQNILPNYHNFFTNRRQDSQNQDSTDSYNNNNHNFRIREQQPLNFSDKNFLQSRSNSLPTNQRGFAYNFRRIETPTSDSDSSDCMAADQSATGKANRRPISFSEEATWAEPVYTRNQNNVQSELDRNLKETQRQQKLQYQQDLKRQMQEQHALRSPRKESNDAALRNSQISNDLDRQMRAQQKAAQLEYNRSLQRQIEEQKMLRSAQNFDSQGRAPRTPELDKQVRQSERAKALQYQKDLQKQIAEQKMKRVQQELDFGGDGVRQEVLKAQRDIGALRGRANTPEDPPWLRGNPQPRNGIRGSNPGYTPGLQSQPQPAPQRQRSMPFDYRYSTQPPTTPGQVPQGSGFNYVSPFSSIGTNQIGSAVAHQREADHRAEQQRLSQEQQFFQQRQRLEQERARKQAQELETYDPFGKGGGGAPVRDKDGRVITDRRKLRKSWNSVQDTNLPHDYDGSRISPSQSMNAGLNQTGYPSDPFLSSVQGYGSSPYSFGQSPAVPSPYQAVTAPAPVVQKKNLSEKDQHMAELKLQIEEKKRQKEMEKERERLEEEKERLRIERDNARIQAEIEEEKRIHQEKIALQEKKQAEAREIARQKAEDDAAARRPAANHLHQPQNQNKLEPENDGLEWWEKKPTRRAVSRQSVVRPLGTTRQAQTSAETPGPVQTPPPEAAYDSAQTLQREEISDSPPLPVRRVSERPKGSDEEEEEMNKSKEIKPRSAMVRNEGVMRQLSAMRERLTKEQVRVKSALRRKEYGEDLFSDDDDDDIALDDVVHQNDDLDLGDVPSFAHNKPKKTKSKSPRPKSNYSGLFSDDDDKAPKSRQKTRRRRSTIGGDDDPPLVSLIKNSRTLLDSSPPDRSKGTSRRSQRGSRRMNGFLSSSDDDDDFLSSKGKKGRRRGSSRFSDAGDISSSNPDRVVNSFMKNRGVSSSSRRDSGF